ncbi:uncharacterized protein LOC143470118 [Clavelina lepadiformis]|uniref:uncharacterized protein LOC143470118 n=1 Tax=Clavelina lepadiformis TaxID=159417 RepID=UPI0040426C42
MARDRVHLLRNIIKDCEFVNLQSFNIEDYKQKHVQKLQREKKTPATFISHSNAMTNFLNFALLKRLPLSFNVGEALLNLKNRRASYRKFLKKRRQLIKERDRRNALDPEEVARVMKNRIFHKTALATKLWEKDPGAEIRRAHGEILMAFLIIQNSQRTSAVRNMLVDELTHGCQTKKHRWIVRVRDHKTSSTYGDATIVMPGWLKEGLDKLVQFNGGTCEIVFPHQGKALTSSAAAKVLQRVWKLAGGRGKFTATSNRKHSATQVRSKRPDNRLLVAKHMAHSSATQERYYANELQNAEAEQAYEVINEIRSCSSAGSEGGSEGRKEGGSEGGQNVGSDPRVILQQIDISSVAGVSMLPESPSTSATPTRKRIRKSDSSVVESPSISSTPSRKRKSFSHYSFSPIKPHRFSHLKKREKKVSIVRSRRQFSADESQEVKDFFENLGKRPRRGGQKSPWRNPYGLPSNTKLSAHECGQEYAGRQIKAWLQNKETSVDYSGARSQNVRQIWRCHHRDARMA